MKDKMEEEPEINDNIHDIGDKNRTKNTTNDMVENKNINRDDTQSSTITFTEHNCK